MAKKWNEGKTFLLVTGASRGLGQAFSVALASKLGKGSTIYLTARTEQSLIQTQEQILSKNETLEVKYFVIDQGNVERESFINMLENIQPENYEYAGESN